MVVLISRIVSLLFFCLLLTFRLAFAVYSNPVFFIVSLLLVSNSRVALDRIIVASRINRLGHFEMFELNPTRF